MTTDNRPEGEQWQMPDGLEPWREYVNPLYRTDRHVRGLAKIENYLLHKLIAAGLLLSRGEKRYRDGVVADFRNERRRLRNDVTRLKAENERLRGELEAALVDGNIMLQTRERIQQALGADHE